MEFHEKLQELRKSRGLTQEELAEALFVSRTAISKWESGRGYPSIDSLKEISSYFSVSIDDLLSGEQLIFIAEKENKSNLNSVCDLLLGFVDLFSLMLIFLPSGQYPIWEKSACSSSNASGIPSAVSVSFSSRSVSPVNCGRPVSIIVSFSCRIVS